MTLRKDMTALALFAALVLSACATPEPAMSPDQARNENLANARSPAAEKIFPNVAELVLSSRPWPSFEEARANRLLEIEDGTPVFAHLRSSRPLGKIARPADADGSMSFSTFPHLYLQVGDLDSVRVFDTCYLTLTPAEAASRELVTVLAPVVRRSGNVVNNCLLNALQAGRETERYLEVRLAGFSGSFDSWMPTPELFATAPLRVRAPKGMPRYQAMLRETAQPEQAVLKQQTSRPVATAKSPPGAPTGQSAAPQPNIAPVPASPVPGPPARSPAVPPAEQSGEAAVVVTPVRDSALRTDRIESGGPTPPTRREIETNRREAEAARREDRIRGEAEARAAVPARSAGASGLSGQRDALMSKAEQALGRRPHSVQFVDEQWAHLPTARGSVWAARALAVFREPRCSVVRLRAEREEGGEGIARVERVGGDVRMDCDELP